MNENENNEGKKKKEITDRQVFIFIALFLCFLYLLSGVFTGGGSSSKSSVYDLDKNYNNYSEWKESNK